MGGGNTVYDANGDPVVNGKVTTTDYTLATRYYSGSSIPDFSGGLTNTFRYE